MAQPSRPIRHLSRIGAVFVSAALATACGSSNDTPTTDASGPTVRQTLHAYGHAANPSAVCDTITLGMQAALDDTAPPAAQPSAPADAHCEQVVAAAVHRGEFSLGPSPIEVTQIAVRGTRAAARVVDANTSDGTHAVFLAKTAAGWRVTAEGFVPPGFQQLAREVLDDAARTPA